MKRELEFSPSSLSEEDFAEFMGEVGALAPQVMTVAQLTSFLATVLQNYCGEDEDLMQAIADAAVDVVIKVESRSMPDLPVGPEDGVH